MPYSCEMTVFIYTVLFFPRILVRTHRELERHIPSLQGKDKERQNKLFKYWLSITSKPSIFALWNTAIGAEVYKACSN